MRPPPECPVCGEPVPPRARACPHCGADERSGWNEDEARYDGIDLPESAFDDEQEETAHALRRRPRRPLRRTPHPVWWLVAATLAALLIASLLAPLF